MAKIIILQFLCVTGMTVCGLLANGFISWFTTVFMEINQHWTLQFVFAGILDDTYALCIARKQPLSVLLSLMEAYSSENDYTVLMCLIDVRGFDHYAQASECLLIDECSLQEIVDCEFALSLKHGSIK